MTNSFNSINSRFFHREHNNTEKSRVHLPFMEPCKYISLKQKQRKTSVREIIPLPVHKFTKQTGNVRRRDK